MVGLYENQVFIENYNNWDELFQCEKKMLKCILHDVECVIEHVGSTAVYGLKAKPIIDIAVGLIDYKDMGIVQNKLIKFGYEFRENHGGLNRKVFIKITQNFRTHHIHVEKFDGLEWHNHVDFKNILISDAEVRNQYEKLKLRLANLYPNNREAYTLGKAKFIQNILSTYQNNRNK